LFFGQLFWEVSGTVSAVEREVQIVNKFGLHARPAMQLVELANKYSCGIEVSKASLTVDAKSIMSVMRLAATKGTTLKIVADGEDAHEAVEALVELIRSGFGEMEAEA
jgi:phosphocarrier protein